MTQRIRIGIDTGGTFTDVVAVDEDTGDMVTTKTPSTPANPADGFLAGIEKVLGLLGAGRRRDRRRQPRHHRRHQPAARGQGRPARLPHHQRLRGDARDRPPVGARRLRQLLLLGEARPDRAARPGPRRRRPARLHRRRGAAVRRGRRPRGGPLVPRPAASPPSASASCTPTPTPPTRSGCATILAEEHPDAVVSISSEVLREYREYERAMTTLVDAAVKPRLSAYVTNIKSRLTCVRRPARSRST